MRTENSSKLLCEKSATGLAVLLLVLTCSALFRPSIAKAQTQLSTQRSPGSPGIVIGFVGGFVHKNDLRHSEVQLAHRLKASYGSDAHVEVLQNRQVWQAHKLILRWLDQDRDGRLSGQEKQQARIILYGHSWGATAAMTLARELERDNIPVLLTVVVDTIRKLGNDDSTIPPNVNEAANFYQTAGLLHGLPRIKAQDPSHTEILGNFRFHYREAPPECRDYPWYDRFFFKGHTSIECDPRVWSQVETLIRGRLQPLMAASEPQAGGGAN
ncbi:MAG TPA: hypothetical protein VKW78_00855 [Terriglobales bacterium]|nr:hypothetical protein [Terriglobales bacterium]